MKKIIVPTDFSLYSINALRTASKIAKKFNSELIILHALELGKPTKALPQSIYDQEIAYYSEPAEEKIKEILEESFLKSIKVTPLIKRLSLIEELNEMTANDDIDLIIMGSHGASGVKDYIIGSNAEKIVRTSNIPVLVVKGLAVKPKFSKAVFASDFSTDSITSYKKAKNLLNLFNCDLTLLFVNTPNNFLTTSEQEEKAINFLKSAGENVEEFYDIDFIAEQNIESGILFYAAKNNFDLIITATKGKNNILKRSISEDVVNHARIPVMTFKI